MRFVIGCALSLIFSANCAYAMAPAKEAPKKGRSQSAKAAPAQEALASIDYSKIVTREIQKELKEQAALPQSAFARPMEVSAAVPSQPRERRKAVVLPSHRSFKAIDDKPASVRGEIKSVDLPPSSAAGNGELPGAVAEIY